MAGGRSHVPDLRWLSIAAGVAVLIAALGLFSSVVDRGFGELGAARAERRRLEQERERLQRRVQVLGETLDRIRTDPAAAEAFARHELGWIRPGEAVVLLATPTPEAIRVPLTRPTPTPILSLRE